MLTPRSVALIGASRKPNSVANDALRNLLSGGYRGAIYPVNPCYRSLYGCACYSAITELAEPVDLVIVSVPNKVLERTVEQALASGARSLVIFASAELEDDGTSRIAAMARCAPRKPTPTTKIPSFSEPRAIVILRGNNCGFVCFMPCKVAGHLPERPGYQAGDDPDLPRWWRDNPKAGGWRGFCVDLRGHVRGFRSH